MGATKKDIKRRTERVSENPVTHQIETVTLDKAQLAYERVVQVMDGKMLDMNPGEQEKFVRLLQGRMRTMVRHTDCILLKGD